MTDLIPLFDRIVVERRDEEEYKHKSVIITPDTAKEKPNYGVVVAAGDGKIDERGNLRRMGVKPGDLILFAKYSGSELTFKEKVYLIMREEDVLCLVKPAEAAASAKG